MMIADGQHNVQNTIIMRSYDSHNNITDKRRHLRPQFRS